MKSSTGEVITDLVVVTHSEHKGERRKQMFPVTSGGVEAFLTEELPRMLVAQSIVSIEIHPRSLLSIAPKYGPRREDD